MNILKKIFGTGKPAKLNKVEAPGPAVDPASDPNMIRVFDAYGREMFITRQQWRDNVLQGNIEKNWDNAEQLAGFIIQSLHDGFFEEMTKPAERLLQLDEGAERGAVLLAIVYLKVGRLDDSERVLQHHISNFGESGSILTNLAKVYAARCEDSKTLQTLWRALELDPNQDNGLGWYEAIHREKDGEVSGQEALRQVAAISGSWRAQLWLARSELAANCRDKAVALYREALARVDKPAPGDMLMQMSGDLGNKGHLAEILQLVGPEFNPTFHGLQVGNNLIKAHIDLGHLEDARKILNELYALKRPDWKPTLGFWDTEIAKAAIAEKKVVTDTPLSVSMLVGQGPIWLKPDSTAAALYPPKSSDSPIISFLGCSAETANANQHVQIQMADGPGRMSRALPLFLSEQVELRTGARTQTIVPWIIEPGSGFVLSGMPWVDEDAVKHVQQSAIKSDYVVLTHLVTKTEPWVVQLRLVRTSDTKCIGQLATSFSMANPTHAIRGLAQSLLDLLSREVSIKQQPIPTNYAVPGDQYFPAYLLRLEQLLAVRCGASENMKTQSLSGEREIIDGNIIQCVDAPTSVNARLLLAQTLLSMKNVRPDILPEFAERIALLQKEKPLAEPARGEVQQIFDEAFAA